MNRTEESIEMKQPTKKELIIREIWDWVKTIIVSVVVALIVTQFVKPTLVSGSSMYPTLEHYNFMLVNRMAYKNKLPEYGDIVIFKTNLENEKVLIKRVIAIEGDKIVVQEGKVFVNDELLNEPYINQEYPITDGNIEAIVPRDTVFVMGDNRGNSLDSRNELVGFVKLETIIGKVFIRLYPLSQFK